MKTILLFLLLWLYKSASSQNVKEIFEKINKDVKILNSIGASIAWDTSVNPIDPELSIKAGDYQNKRINWQDRICDELVNLNNEKLLNETQKRQTYLLCRGPKFTFNEARKASDLYQNLQSIYSEAKICLPVKQNPGNLEEIEATILNYLTAVKQILKTETDTTAVKIAANFDVDKKDALCLKGEAEFQKLMRFSRNEKVLRWVWLMWREKVGKTIRKPYDNLVKVENAAACRNGYRNIGASWREELEINNLRQFCRQLYYEIRPLYTLLHGVTRFFLRKFYGNTVSEKGPIPAHLLGDLWSQNWESLVNLITDEIDLDDNISKLNWTVKHMVKRTEDFYQSMGLPPMTDLFWRNSVFTPSSEHNTRCHGTAADMFKDGDFRLLYCSGQTAEDLYVLHHEMGHIQYYMAYENQPAIFRLANTALHETIGDTIMLGVMTPQHLHRLGLINDTLLYNNNTFNNDNEDDFDELLIINSYEKNLIDEIETKQSVENERKTSENFYDSDNGNQDTYNNARMTMDIKRNLIDENYQRNVISKSLNIQAIDNRLQNENEKFDTNNEIPKIKMTTDEILMLKTALNKIPQIPLALLIDEYRWKYFEGTIDADTANEEFWNMTLELQGIAPPDKRGEEYFDVAAKFHVPDNTPYIRYFLSSFLQHQLYESVCKAAVYGRRGVTESIPRTITWNRCDIYGSKAAEKLLKDIMSRGHSQTLQEILQATIGVDAISADALKRYYRPLYKRLIRFVKDNRIPIGW